MYISDTNVNDSCGEAACAVSISGSVLYFMVHMAVVLRGSGCHFRYCVRCMLGHFNSDIYWHVNAGKS